MTIHNIADNYISSIIKGNNLSDYERSFPELFTHYFTYWANRDSFHMTLSESEVRERLELIESKIPYLEKQFECANVDTSNIDVILFVGQNTANGHAFRFKEKFVAWIPIETYHTSSQAETFVAHEILHAVHYSHIPEFYFESLAEKNSVSRQIITEGLATFLSKNVLGISEAEALWSDYVTEPEANGWIAECDEMKNELYKYAVRKFKTKDMKTQLFYVSNSGKISESRVGYFIGLRLIDGIAKENNLSNRNLLKLRRPEFERLAIGQLCAP